MNNCCDSKHAGADLTSAAVQPLSPDPQARLSSRFRIDQMDCPTEQRLITDKLAGMPGIGALGFNLLERTLTLEHTAAALPAALQAIRSLGFIPEPLSADAPSPPSPPPRLFDWRLVLAALLALAAEMLHLLQPAAGWLSAAPAVAAIVLCGLGTYSRGWIALKNRDLNINALMSIAVTGALLIGQWPEAAMVMVLFTLAERIEARSLDRARHAIRSLLDLTPDTATVRQSDGSWLNQPLTDIGLHSQIRVRPGERIGLDGVVVSGYSSVDQSPITGESLPLDKQPGDAVFAGSINQHGELQYRVTALAGHSTLARIIHAVEQAQNTRAPTQRFVDRFARIYTPLVFILALAVALLPPLLWAASWLDWIYRALVLLVVACPCALVISTPVSIVSGLAAAARRGILIKGGSFLEQGHRLTHLALDKTGTLTRGRPEQTDFQPLTDDLSAAAMQSIAASLARRSDHPVSRALTEHATEHGTPLSEVSQFSALPGLGSRGEIDGCCYHLGNHRLLEQLGLCSPGIEARLEQLESQGRSVIVLSDSNRALALFAVADQIKSGSADAIQQLHRLGIRTLMLSGDNPHTAAAIAAQVGIDEARGNLLPADKLAHLEMLAQPPARVGMVGDGINDAPALARADIGFAMGAMGADTAIETADVAIMDDDLRRIPEFIRLSRRTHRILVQNITLALGIKAVFLALTLSGHATMWMAVFADMGVSLLVILNGLRLLHGSKGALRG